MEYIRVFSKVFPNHSFSVKSSKSRLDFIMDDTICLFSIIGSGLGYKHMQDFMINTVVSIGLVNNLDTLKKFLLEIGYYKNHSESEVKTEIIKFNDYVQRRTTKCQYEIKSKKNR